MAIREFSQFCRILSLVLFEPDDRQIIEGNTVLRSIELLQLRRDRMSRNASTTEENLSLVIGMPHFLERMVQLIRLINYGPTLQDSIQYNMASSLPPFIIELLETINMSSDRDITGLARGQDLSDWEIVDCLDKKVKQRRKQVRTT